MRKVAAIAASAVMAVVWIGGSVRVSGQAQNGDAARGKYLVEAGGCHDCHTPKTPGAKGLEADQARLLSGFPQDRKLPPPPKIAEGPWAAVALYDLTAWSGPWGVSYAANLTPDKETGLGNWTPEVFVSAIRSGKHMGVSRPILPPMPWETIGKLTDEDLRAIFAYLKTITPVKNPVPAPLPPAR